MSTQLIEGVEALNLTLNESQLTQLEELLSQLLKWNKTFNLTAIKTEDEAIRLHLLDSLAVLPYWSFAKTIDVGTGAGFPGLPLAIALPDQQFHLLDSNSKKIRFIRQLVHDLGLKNVTPIHARVEQHNADDYDCVVSRAFASLNDMLSWTKHLLPLDKYWMAMKGVYDSAEIEQLPDYAKFESVTELEIPGLSADRCLIKMVRRND